MTQSILITGCSTGIGQHCAIRLRESGYRVLATVRNPDDVVALEAMGLESFVLDLNSSASIERGVAHALELTGGRLDALFNNGAYGQPGAVEDLSRGVLRAQFETNVFGWVELTNRVLPIMRQQGSGRIIMNSSVLGLVAMKYRGAYNASKFAIEGITDTYRQELRGSGIHISLIEPGPISSAFRHNALTAFKRNINYIRSAHAQVYAGVLKRLEGGDKQDSSFTLPPEAVFKALQHALESKRPRPRYYVTVPTYLLGYLRRVLPTRWLDRLLARAADSENR
ncbi:MAG: SDR family oxidoreductase [Oceanospirillales bacterium]|uniref:Short-subunit dehydrogenase n=1 Tax=Marinobacterium halophilum TaxID=267374 RepID=A0A2P8EXG8_9GAMM|nr:SDR family oxidoreductase [Marinobacterium halophilum]MBR9827189.1 SDR family oxidoreductase [Oceanospirillales bacterium]PSL14168.1 short-subunit dehydrogenase [Marinobacterium halophilum]